MLGLRTLSRKLILSSKVGEVSVPVKPFRKKGGFGLVLVSEDRLVAGEQLPYLFLTH
jgi:hypothetical protein